MCGNRAGHSGVVRTWVVRNIGNGDGLLKMTNIMQHLWGFLGAEQTLAYDVWACPKMIGLNFGCVRPRIGNSISNFGRSFCKVIFQLPPSEDMFKYLK